MSKALAKFVFSWLGYSTQGDFFLVPSICLWLSRFHFSPLSSNPIHICTTFSLSIVHLHGIFHNSRFWLLQIMLLWTWVNRCPCCMNEHLFGLCLRVELLHLVLECLPFSWGTTIMMSIVSVPTCSLFFHPLQHKLSSVFLILAILSGGRDIVSQSCFNVHFSDV